MVNYWMLVNRVIRQADVLLEVLDARMIYESRNREIEDKVNAAGKILIFVINKCDLAKKEDMDEAKKELRPAVFMSATERLGTSFLRRELFKFSKGNPIIVGVLGYPNTGKSSVINTLKGKKAVGVASISGFTRSLQKVKISKNIYLIDTPGVFPYKEKDETKHAMLSARTFTNLTNPETSAVDMIQRFSAPIAKFYGVKDSDDAEEVLERIALKMRKLKKGGKADTYSASVMFLKDWQEGRIKVGK